MIKRNDDGIIVTIVESEHPVTREEIVAYTAKIMDQIMVLEAKREEALADLATYDRLTSPPTEVVA